MLCLINRKRAENGESPLQSNPQLEQAAEGHCQELITDDYFAHVSPSGETPGRPHPRRPATYPAPSVGYVIGENLAWGTYQLVDPPGDRRRPGSPRPGTSRTSSKRSTAKPGSAITPGVPASLAGGAPGATYAQEFGVIIR